MEKRIRKILVPVDGTVGSDHAVEHLIGLVRDGLELDVHLMHVPVPIESAYLRRFLTGEMVHNYYRDEANGALESATALLDHARVKYHRIVEPGRPAETIVRYVHAQACDGIVMGTRGMGSLGNLVVGSVAVRVLHLADVPVTLVK